MDIFKFIYHNEKQLTTMKLAEWARQFSKQYRTAMYQILNGMKHLTSFEINEGANNRNSKLKTLNILHDLFSFDL